MTSSTVRDAAVARENIRARAGERMWVLLNHVKADKREVFEHFIQNVLAPAAQRIGPDIYRHVRVLQATEANEKDGSYTYFFLMDPLIPDADYSIANLLQQAYPPEQAREYEQMWDDSLASPQVGYEVVQSAW